MLLVLLERAASSLQEASAYLDEVIEACDGILAGTDGRDSGWKELACAPRWPGASHVKSGVTATPATTFRVPLSCGGPSATIPLRRLRSGGK